MTLKIDQGHCQWHNSIGYIITSINLLQNIDHVKMLYVNLCNLFYCCFFLLFLCVDFCCTFCSVLSIIF